MSDVDAQYIGMLSQIVDDGLVIDSRNARTMRLEGLTAKFDTTPLVSLRRTAWRSAIREMEWFMSGSENINDLHPSIHKWWKPWADATGRVANNYSKQFRRFSDKKGSFDQVAFFLDAIRNHPNSRRTVMTTWNPAEMVSSETKITNCHGSLVQAFVGAANKLDLIMYQRSADMVVGTPHNFIQYWAFLLWVAAQTGREPGTFTWIGGDCHIYESHLPLVQKLKDLHAACGASELRPQLVYNGEVGSPFKADDFCLSGLYVPLCSDSAEMVV